MSLKTSKLNLFRVISAAVLAVAVIFMPFYESATAYAESDERDWEEMAPDGELLDDATITKYAVLMDALTGEILYEENADTKQYPASITKIMTCLLAIENCELDEVVTVGNVDIDESEATMIGIEEGEEITVEALLYGLMLESGNDAALALAIHIAGSVSAFADMMNAKAEELEMYNSHFVNPHGLHDDDHYTTARDMAKLAYAAMQNDIFREIVSTYHYTPEFTNVHTAENPWDSDQWENTNKLISEVYDEEYKFDDSNGYAIGIKTGHTSSAEYTLVSAAISKDETQEVIAVTLYDTANGRYYDSITMFQYAFDFYDTLDLKEFLSDELSGTAHVENAEDSDTYDNLTTYAVPVGDAYVTDTTEAIELLESQPERFTKVETITSDLIAPIELDEQIGTVEFYLDDGDEPVMTCNLYAANEIEAMPEATPEPTATPAPTSTPAPEFNAMELLSDYYVYLVIGLAAVIILIIIISAINSSRRRARHIRRGTPNSRSRAPSPRSKSSGPKSGASQRGRGRRR